MKEYSQLSKERNALAAELKKIRSKYERLQKVCARLKREIKEQEAFAREYGRYVFEDRSDDITR